MSISKASFASSIAGASIILALISVLSKGFGFFREILYASTFGLSKEFDLYLVSAAIPITINTAVIYIGQHYFVPAYHKLKINSNEEALRFFNSSFYLFILGGIVIAALLALFSNLIIVFFISDQASSVKHLSTNLFLLFLITIPLNAGISILSSYMQSEFKFISPAIAQLLLNLIIIVMVISLSSSLNIYVLPSAFVFGNLVAFSLLTIMLVGVIKFPTIKYFKELKIDHYDFLFLLIIIELVSLSYPIIDRYFYAQIPQGGIAALNYALTIYSMPVSIITLALITAIFPKFSKEAAENKDELITALKKGININIFIMVPIALILFFNGYEIIKLFFERGEFTASDTYITNKVLLFYSYSLVFYSTYLIVIKLLYSLSMHLSILIISVLGFIIKMVLNYSLVNGYQQNGLAISTSLVFLFLFIAGFFIAGNKLNLNLNIFCLKGIIYNSINALIAYFIVIPIIKILGLNELTNFILEIILFALLYGVNSALIKSDDYKIALNLLKNYSPARLKMFLD